MGGTVSPAAIQAAYNSGKTLAATAASTFAAFAAALLALEQNNQTLESLGAPSIAQWFRASAANLPAGYQTYGNMPAVAVKPQNPAFAQDPTFASSVGPVTNTDTFKLFGLTP
jgi:hypothetical protein